jgi:hypothetical protein
VTAPAPTLRLASVGGVAALLVAALLGVDGARRDTPTVDEFAHLPAGCALWRHGSFHHYAVNPPLGKLLIALPVVLSGARVPSPTPAGAAAGAPAGGAASEWAPWIYGQRFMAANAERLFALFFRARLVTLAIFLAGGVLLQRWSTRLWGERAGVLALLLWLFCPNLQAHGRLATLDVPVTVAVLAAFYALHRYAMAPSAARLALAAGLAGVAVLTKFTALLTLPVLGALSLATPGVPLRRRLARLGAAAAMVWMVVQLGYGWRQPTTRLDVPPLRSQFGQAAARLVPAGWSVPLPDALVRGLDAQKLALERGEFGNYLLGRWTRQGSPAHELVTLLVKVPLATQALGWLAVVLMVRSPRHRLDPLGESFVWACPALLLAAFSLGSNLHVGVRYLLPILPFAFLGAARVAAAVGERPPPFAAPRGRWSRLAVPAVAAALVATTVACHPRQLSFFNLLAGGPANGHRVLLDSNLDWGQDLWRVPPYVDRQGLDLVYLLYFGHLEPGLYGIHYRLPPPAPAAGTYVVSVNFARGYSYVAPDHGAMVAVRGGAPRWLRERRPVDRIGDSLWVYRVP